MLACGLEGILRACERIARYVGSRSRQEALGDDLILDGILMNFHVVPNHIPVLRAQVPTNFDETPSD